MLVIGDSMKGRKRVYDETLSQSERPGGNIFWVLTVTTCESKEDNMKALPVSVLSNN